MVNNKKLKKNDSKLKIKIISMEVEKVLNLLWSSGIEVNNLKRDASNTIVLEIRLKDYRSFLKNIKNTKSKFEIINREGLYYTKAKYKGRVAFFAGIFLFFVTIFYLQSYIWDVEINTEQNLSPFEVREFLESNNIIEGRKIRDIDVTEIEELLTMNHKEVIWARAKVYGTTLKIDVSEKKNPPEVVADDEPSNFIASKDGQIMRMYTESGTTVVEVGDVVKKGDLLVKGIQGKEGSEYTVNSDGQVIAKTFYEKIETYEKVETVRKRTGEKRSQIYFEIFGKKIFIKNQLNIYDNYDKMVDNKNFIKSTTYYEVVEEEQKITDVKEFVDDVHNQMFQEITLEFDRDITVVDTIKDYKENDEKITVRLVVVAEENIAEEINMNDEERQKYENQNDSEAENED